MKKKHSLAKNHSLAKTNANYWITGRHSISAALNNPKRNIKRYLSCDAETTASNIVPEIVSKDDIARITGLPNNTKQAVLTTALKQESLQNLLQTKTDKPQNRIWILLDKVTDPNNAGAVLRTAAAFQASAVIVTSRHHAPENTHLARAACGGLERVPYLQVSNLAQTITLLKKNGVFVFGLEASGEMQLSQLPSNADVAIVAGSEGHGLRKLTKSLCHDSISIPMGNSDVDSLNISNAMAIALHSVFINQN